MPLLIPVLTDFPLPLSDMGDILGGGLILTLSTFIIVLAGLDSGSAYGGIGSSRAVMLTILAEPALILVFVGITLLAKAMLPFVVNHLLVENPAVYWGPAHLFLLPLQFATQSVQPSPRRSVGLGGLDSGRQLLHIDRNRRRNRAHRPHFPQNHPEETVREQAFRRRTLSPHRLHPGTEVNG